MLNYLCSDLHMVYGRACDFGNNDIKWINKHESLRVKKTYILGDGPDTEQGKYRYIKRVHYKLFNYFDSIDIENVAGNHDSSIYFKNSITIKLPNKRKALGIHSDLYDKKMRKYWFKKIKWVLGIVERIPLPDFHKADNPEDLPFVKKQYDKTVKEAREYAKSFFNKYDIVFMGHTHKQGLFKFNNNILVDLGNNMHGNFQGSLFNDITCDIKMVNL